MNGIHSLNELSPKLKNAGPGDLLALDIDQTLIRSPFHYGSEAWYYWRIEYYEKAGEASESAIWKANSDWEESQMYIESVLTEAKIPDWFKAWGKNGLSIVGLTARASSIIPRTFVQITNAGIRFSQNLFPKQFQVGEIFFQNEILFATPMCKKGESLARVLASTGVRPKKVYFVDDRAEHVESMLSEMNALNIPCEAFQYLPAEKINRAFDLEASERERRSLQSKKV